MTMPQYQRYPGFPKPTVDCSKDKLLTVQADAQAADINQIVKRIQKGALVPEMNGEPFYGDVSELGGLQESFIKIREANELFYQYPADLREKFDNDPVKLIEFLENTENLDAAVELGLVQKPLKEEKAEEPKTSPVPEQGK